MGSLAHYDVGDVLGSGQFSVVHRAQDRRSGRTVAMEKLQVCLAFATSAKKYKHSTSVAAAAAAAAAATMVHCCGSVLEMSSF